jgi:hypothetical protein
VRTAALLTVLLAAGGCAFYGDPCQKQIAECLERCDRRGDALDERTGTDRSGPPVLSPGENTTTACERDCQQCRPTKSGDPGQPPTPTS